MTTPFAPDHLIRVRRLGAFDISADGRWLVACLDELSEDGKKYDTNLWRLDLSRADAELVPLTRNTRRKGSPRFAPDGTLLFLSQPDPARKKPAPAPGATAPKPESDAKPEEAPQQLHRMPVDGGEADCLTSFATGVNDFRPTKDGRRLVLMVPVHPAAKDLADNDRLEKEWKERKPSGVVHDAYPLRYWDHFHGPTHGHLVVAEADGSNARDLTPGLVLGLSEPEWDVSPDGRRVVTDIRIVDRETRRIRRNLFEVDLETGARKQLTEGTSWHSGPRYSPDGRRLAYTRHEEKMRVTGREELCVMDLASGSAKHLAADLDLWPMAPRWIDDRTLLFQADDHGSHVLRRIDVETGAHSTLTKSGHASGVLVAPDRRHVYFLQDTVHRPDDLHRVPAGGGDVQRLTAVNDGLLAELSMGTASSHVVTGHEGAPVQLWEVLPPGFDPKKKYPLLLWIHGGPIGAFLDQFHFRWNPHLYASQGYVLILVNPRGSTGFGQAFIEANNGNWGDHCYHDLMRAVDEWSRKPYVDADRMAALGASFGGYMANWIAGHETRFKCLVSHAGLYNLTAFHGTTDGGAEWELEFGGRPWDNPELYEKHSPHHHVKKFRTPTLVIHGELDYRVPLGDGLQMFQALQELQVPSKLLYFPDENHWILKPANMKQWNETVLAWLGEWLKT